METKQNGETTSNEGKQDGEGEDKSKVAEAIFAKQVIVLSKRLMKTIRKGKYQLIELLISDGANINYRDDRWRDTPLHICATYDRPKCAKILLYRGADIHATNIFGSTPMDNAIKCQRSSMITTLLRGGAKVTLADIKLISMVVPRLERVLMIQYEAHELKKRLAREAEALKIKIEAEKDVGKKVQMVAELA